jgi:hypothetical protein
MQTYTTTSEVIARLGVLEKDITALLARISDIREELINNGVIIADDAIAHDNDQ